MNSLRSRHRFHLPFGRYMFIATSIKAFTMRKKHNAARTDFLLVQQVRPSVSSSTTAFVVVVSSPPIGTETGDGVLGLAELDMFSGIMKRQLLVGDSGDYPILDFMRNKFCYRLVDSALPRFADAYILRNKIRRARACTSTQEQKSTYSYRRDRSPARTRANLGPAGPLLDR
jgi:hypothetical protein